MQTATKTAMTRMHIALNVLSIERSQAFYAAFLGLEPTKVKPGYAKFTLDDPGLVLTLNEARDVAPRTVLSHMGFQVASNEALERARSRVAAAGLTITLDEAGVTCCYAVQDKFWVADPDGNAWEVYVFLEDAETFAGAAAAPTESATGCCPGEVACADTSC